MEFGNGHIMGADSLANLAVITKFEPFGRDDFPLKPETFSIGTSKFRAWKKTSGSQYRTVGVADGTFDALIYVGFHFYIFSPQSAQRPQRKNIPIPGGEVMGENFKYLGLFFDSIPSLCPLRSPSLNHFTPAASFPAKYPVEIAMPPPDFSDIGSAWAIIAPAAKRLA
jgi:hypothetical protein